jgi:hypothetical protein
VARAFVPALARVSQRLPARERDLCLITLASLQTGVNTHLTLNPSPSERDLCFFSTPGCLSKDTSTIRPHPTSTSWRAIEHPATKSRFILRRKPQRMTTHKGEPSRYSGVCTSNKTNRCTKRGEEITNLARVFEPRPCAPARLVPLPVGQSSDWRKYSPHPKSLSFREGLVFLFNTELSCPRMLPPFAPPYLHVMASC